jgi:hypothetical protein
VSPHYPRYSKLVTDAASLDVLLALIERCNPGQVSTILTRLSNDLPTLALHPFGTCQSPLFPSSRPPH